MFKTSFMWTLVLFSQYATADLLISPTRVSFDEHQRSKKVTVINSSMNIEHIAWYGAKN